MTIRHETGSVIDLEEKAISESEEAWTISGYASIFDNVDLGNDVVLAGAFSKSLRQNGMPLLLFNHKMEDAPIGTVTDAKEDKRGLWFKAELPKDDSFVAGRIVPQLKRRGLKGTSIGYKATQKERRKSDGARLLKEIRLFEISVVNMPMNPEAGVENIKGIVPFQDLPIADPAAWDYEAAMKRLEEKLRAGAIDEVKRAFLFWDEDEDGIKAGKYLIADFDESKGCLTVNRVALFKSVAAMQGSRKGDDLPEGADEAIKSHLERYYQRLDLESPFKSLSKSEFDALEWGEREARLRALGLSRGLAKDIVEGLKRAPSGQRDADRKSVQPEAGPNEDAMALLSAAFSEMCKAATAIKR